MDIFQLVAESGFVDPPEVVYPPSHMSREVPEAPGPCLDDWLWDEAFADEKYDTVLEVNKRCDLVKALGGPRATVGQMVLAAEKGDLTLIKALVKRDAKAANSIMDEIGRNFLHVAAEHGRSLACAWVVKNGMDVNKATLYGLTPLMCAAAWGQEVTCELLLDLGADATLRDRHGRTALSFASDGLRSTLVRHPNMIKCGRDVMGADIDALWAPPKPGSGRKEAEVHEQFQSSHKGKGFAEKYNMRLLRGVVGAAVDQVGGGDRDVDASGGSAKSTVSGNKK